ncbi:MAG TPA: condensation domain-containing protein, partial [Longimicrobiaceae bacterium]
TLRRAFEALVRRHESLRTVFGTAGSEPVQVIHPPAPFALAPEELSRLAGAERDAEVTRLALEEARKPVDLAAGPLLRVRLLRTGADEHVLLLMVHHAVSDAWSFGVLFRELSALYRAFVRGEPSPLPEPALQYADFAVWQRAWLVGETLERQVAYWRGRLCSAPALLALPTDRPRPAVQTHRAGIHDFRVPPDTAARLHALNRRAGATLFMALLAALAVVLRRWSGQDDVVVGTPIAGRTRGETEGMIGFFVNMLALRTDLADDPSLGELLARVREATLGAYAHQDVPFERLLEELDTERSLSHPAVYQVALTLHNTVAEPLDLPGVSAAPLDARARSAAFDLALALREDPDGGITASAVYAADLFDAATVEAMAAYWTRVLEDAGADPDRRLSEVTPLLDGERAQLLAWNATERDVAPAVVHGLVRVREGVAVEQEGAEALTYAELERRADGVAHALVRLGVGPETRVGICLERSPRMLAAVLGTLRAGGAYVPLDPAYPADRLAYMLEDSGARVVVTGRRLADALPPTKLLFIEDSGEADSPPAVAVDPDNAAYVIYTSGSTGKPKGVVVPHRALAHYAAAAVELFGITPADRVLQFASLSFDTSVEEIFPALLGGARLVLRTEAMLGSAATFFDRVRARGVTVLDLPTAYWHELVAELERGAAEVPPCVRLVIVGGERVLPERVAAWRRSV